MKACDKLLENLQPWEMCPSLVSVRLVLTNVQHLSHFFQALLCSLRAVEFFDFLAFSNASVYLLISVFRHTSCLLGGLLYFPTLSFQSVSYVNYRKLNVLKPACNLIKYTVFFNWSVYYACIKF